MRRILVAGASGGTGRHVLSALSGRDATVRALTRSAEKAASLEALGADEVVTGDLLDSDDAARAAADCDAVLCAVGTDYGPALLGDLVDGTGTVNLVEVAEAAGVEQFVLVSTIGVGDSRAGASLVTRLTLRFTGILAAKERAERRLRESDLAHTIFRPGALSDRPATDAVLAGEGGDTVRGSISRADLARVMVAALDTPAARDRTFEVVSEEGCLGEPRGLIDVDWAFPE
ncbi:3-beta hydroxysteroid dehydrogenase [Halobacteriales archaeon QS_1_68_17]|nr:MAG: 3-beta hydroxysteroid dehydrogenase [Halobacteriales archaeon QS_1_68_17]